MDEYKVNSDRVIKAIEMIYEALGAMDASPLEGAVAMRAILATLAEKGLDVQSERKLQS